MRSLRCLSRTSAPGYRTRDSVSHSLKTWKTSRGKRWSQQTIKALRISRDLALSRLPNQCIRRIKTNINNKARSRFWTRKGKLWTKLKRTSTSPTWKCFLKTTVETSTATPKALCESWTKRTILSTGIRRPPPLVSLRGPSNSLRLETPSTNQSTSPPSTPISCRKWGWTKNPRAILGDTRICI